MSSPRNVRKASDVFSVSLTEFILIMVFVLLAVVAHFSVAGTKLAELEAVAQDLRIKLDNAQLRVDQIEVERERVRSMLTLLLSQLQTLADNLGLAPPEHAEDLYTLAENISKTTAQINTLIDQPLKLEEGDWKKLVFIKDTIAGSKKSLDWVMQQTEIEGALGRCEDALDDTRKRCGTGYPLCQGSGKWLADIVASDEGFEVIPSSPAKGIAVPFEPRLYGVNEFREVSQAHLRHSRSQRPECRYQIRWFDDIGSRSIEKYKKYSAIIDEVYYDHRLQEDPRDLQ